MNQVKRNRSNYKIKTNEISIHIWKKGKKELDHITNEFKDRWRLKQYN